MWKEGQTWRQIPKFPFLDIYQRKSTHPLFGAWSLFLVHFHFIPSEGPKAMLGRAGIQCKISQLNLAKNQTKIEYIGCLTDGKIESMGK
jgi:hypothetical protein